MLDVCLCVCACLAWFPLADLVPETQIQNLSFHYKTAAVSSPPVTLLQDKGIKREIERNMKFKHQLLYSVIFRVRFTNKSQAKPHLFAHTQCMWSNIYVASSKWVFLAWMFTFLVTNPCLSHSLVANTLEKTLSYYTTLSLGFEMHNFYFDIVDIIV